jgi:hypothetical protein
MKLFIIQSNLNLNLFQSNKTEKKPSFFQKIFFGNIVLSFSVLL